MNTIKRTMATLAAIAATAFALSAQDYHVSVNSPVGLKARSNEDPAKVFVAEEGDDALLGFRLFVPNGAIPEGQILRLNPDLSVNGEHRALSPILVGRDGVLWSDGTWGSYDELTKLGGNKIDTVSVVDPHQLRQFIKRNMPYVYDGSMPRNTLSYWGVSEKEAVKHYGRKYILKNGDSTRYPDVTASPNGGFRLDGVENVDGGRIYRFIYGCPVPAGNSVADVLLNGSLGESDGANPMSLTANEPLRWSVSSPSRLASIRERIAALADANATVTETDKYEIVFASGSAVVNSALGNNASELERIREAARKASLKEGMKLDNVAISAFASPEGYASFNRNLSGQRAASVASWLKSNGISVPVTSEAGGENWADLDKWVASSGISAADKGIYEDAKSVSDLDARENAIRKMSSFQSIFKDEYPHLRVVKVDFNMHYTDQAYAEGVKALQDGDYGTAAKLLAPYADANTALAYAGAGRYDTAEVILSELPDNAHNRKVAQLVADLREGK